MTRAGAMFAVRVAFLVCALGCGGAPPATQTVTPPVVTPPSRDPDPRSALPAECPELHVTVAVDRLRAHSAFAPLINVNDREMRKAFSMIDSVEFCMIDNDRFMALLRLRGSENAQSVASVFDNDVQTRSVDGHAVARFDRTGEAADLAPHVVILTSAGGLTEEAIRRYTTQATPVGPLLLEGEDVFRVSVPGIARHAADAAEFLGYMPGGGGNAARDAQALLPFARELRARGVLTRDALTLESEMELDTEAHAAQAAQSATAFFAAVRAESEIAAMEQMLGIRSVLDTLAFTAEGPVARARLVVPENVLQLLVRRMTQ